MIGSRAATYVEKIAGEGFGVLILIMPRFLNYFVAIYLILAELLGLGAIR